MWRVIIAAAGKAAHLPGVLAAYTVLPDWPAHKIFYDGRSGFTSVNSTDAGWNTSGHHSG